MTHSKITVLLIKSSQFRKHGKRTRILRLQKPDCCGVLSAVVIHLEHLFHLPDAKDLPELKPVCLKHLIRRSAAVDQTILCGMLIHVRTF